MVVVTFFENLTWDAYIEMRDSVYRQRDALFIENAKDIRNLLSAIDAA